VRRRPQPRGSVGLEPMTPGIQPGKVRENDTAPLRDPAKRNKGGRPVGSQNRYTGALKELFLLAAENVGDCLKIGPNGERHGEGGALAFLETCAVTEPKTFLTVMARLLPITIKSAPPIKKVLTRPCAGSARRWRRSAAPGPSTAFSSPASWRCCLPAPRAQGAGGLPMPDVKALVFDTRGDELTAHRQIRYPDGTRAPLWGWVHGGRV
jgi:hypothetical protein